MGGDGREVGRLPEHRVSTEVSRVLVVADDEVERSLVAGLVRDASSTVEVDTTWWSPQVPATGEAPQVDCVVLVTGRPDPAGLEMLESVRNARVDLPVVVVAGGGDDTAALSALAAGADDFLDRTDVDASVLWRTIRFAVVRRRASERPTDVRDVNRTAPGPAFLGPAAGPADAAGLAASIDQALEKSVSGIDAVAVLSVHVAGSRHRGVAGFAGEHEIVEVIGDAVPSDAWVAVRGGGRFVVVLPCVETADEVFAVADRVNVAVAGIDSDEVSAVTQGVAFATQPDTDDGVALMERAEMAVGTALGRDLPFQVFDPESVRLLMERLGVRRELRSAIGDGSLVLEFQPVVDMDTRRVEGFEALTRWRRGGTGLMSPDWIFPLARRTVVLAELTGHVVTTACRAALDWSEARGAPLFVSVNIGPDELRDPTVVDVVRTALAETGWQPAMLWLEVPGDVLIDDLLTARLEELAAIGVRLVLDGYGGTLATPARLSEAPFEIAKIDRGLGAGLSESLAGRAVYASTVASLESAGILAIATGIETEVQRERAVLAGCRLGQGFGLCRPLTAPDALAVAAGETVAAGDASPRRKWFG